MTRTTTPRWRLVRARQERGWSQQQTCDEVNKRYPHIRLDVRQLGRWERGETRKPYPANVFAVSQTLGVAPEELDLPSVEDIDFIPSPVASTRHDHSPQPTTEQPLIATTSAGIAIPAYAKLPSTPLQVSEDEFTMLRRQFLQWLLSFAGTSGATPAYLPFSRSTDVTDIEPFLHECEAHIRACWRLMHGRDMIVVPTVLMSWLPSLESILRRPSPHQGRLAAVASEAYILAGLVTVLQGHHDRAEWCCRQAVEYATVARNPDLTVAALKHLAAKYLSAQYPLLTLRTYQQAIPYLGHASPLLRSRTHLGLALAYAQVGNRRDADQHLELAHVTFPDDPETDSAFVYADARRASLNHYGGLIHLAFDRPQQAWETFAAVAPHPSAGGVPERTVIQIVNCQTEAALAFGDLELASTHLETAASAARDLGSPKRLRDSAKLYAQLRSRWPTDHRVKRLEPLFRLDDLLLGPALDK